VLLAAAPAGLFGPPRLVWNVTGSAPVGLYLVTPRRAPAIGEWAAVAPPKALAAWLDARGYAPHGVLLIKRVAARSPQRICRHGGLLMIDGVAAARARDADQTGRALPRWSGCQQLTDAEVFLLNTHPASLDGRYFGPLSNDAVVGQARLIWTSARRGDAP
jgi:type IV secretory pathway protease TraF